MPTFVKLTEYRKVPGTEHQRNDRPVYVNASQVLRMTSNGPSTQLLLGPGLSVDVVETPEEILVLIAQETLGRVA